MFVVVIEWVASSNDAWPREPRVRFVVIDLVASVDHYLCHCTTMVGANDSTSGPIL